MRDSLKGLVIKKGLLVKQAEWKSLSRIILEHSVSGLVVKNPLLRQESQETQVRSLGQDFLEQEAATCSSILAWKIP